ncbi:MAG TPA: hemolysin III family protein [Acidimicrobiales bacterium]
MPEVFPPTPAPSEQAESPSLAEEWAAAWAERPRLRGWQHVAAILPTIGVGVALTARARSRRERVAAGAWGVGMVGMLVSSASYHRLSRSERTARVLRRLDHAAIWGAVAGTWTPVALAVLPGAPGVALAGGMWGTAVTAAAAKTAAFDRVDPKVNVLYVLMGWAGIAILPRTVRQLGPTATGFLVAGGTAYTVGAIGYATKRPNLVPGVYGYHELWHTATLAGAGLHAVAVKGALDVIRAQDARIASS